MKSSLYLDCEQILSSSQLHDASTVLAADIISYQFPDVSRITSTVMFVSRRSAAFPKLEFPIHIMFEPESHIPIYSQEV